MSKKALGRGLSALFSEPGETTEKATGESRASEIRMLSLENISINPNQPRTEFDEEALQELADSIRQKGILQPLVVNSDGNERYTVIAGERRFRAAKLAGLAEVPVLIKTMSKLDQFEIALIENIQREDLTPLEEAQAYATLIKESGLTQDDVAKLVGKNRSTVTNSLRLLKMPKDMLDALNSGELTPGHARAILSLTNPSDQRILFKRIIGDGMSVRKAEEQAQQLSVGRRTVEKKEVKPETVKKREPEFADFEKKLLTRYGTKAEIQGTFNGGKIVLHYFSADE